MSLLHDYRNGDRRSGYGMSYLSDVFQYVECTEFCAVFVEEGIHAGVTTQQRGEMLVVRRELPVYACGWVVREIFCLALGRSRFQLPFELSNRTAQINHKCVESLSVRLTGSFLTWSI
jgi:hypothetical protein